MDPTSGEPAAAGGNKARKARTPVEIDLPASAAREAEAPTQTEAQAQSETIPAPEAMAEATAAGRPAGSSFMKPTLAGFVAGAIGGVGAWFLAGQIDGSAGKLTQNLDQRLTRIEQSRPAAALPADLAERLARTESFASEAQTREQALRNELTRLQGAIAAEQAERGKALAALGERASGTPQVVIQPPPGASPDLAQELEKLRSRLATIESGTRPLSEAIGTVAARSDSATTRLEALSPRLDEMNARIEGFAPRLASVSDQVASLAKSLSGIASSDDLSRASAQLVAIGLAAESFQRQEALGGAIETLKALGVAAERLAPLAPFASTGAASPAQLLVDLKAIAAKIEPQNAGGGDFLERLRAGAASLVEVRRTGEITGTDDAAHLARAEQALQRGDIATAVTLVSRLTPARAQLFAPWQTKAAQRMAGTEALARIRSESLARLSRAATAQK